MKSLSTDGRRKVEEEEEKKKFSKSKKTMVDLKDDFYISSTNKYSCIEYKYQRKDEDEDFHGENTTQSVVDGRKKPRKVGNEEKREGVTKDRRQSDSKSSGLSFLSMLSGGFAQSMFDDGEESEQRDGKKKRENSSNNPVVNDPLVDRSLQCKEEGAGGEKKESLSVLDDINIEELIIDVANGIAFQKFKNILDFLEKKYWEEKCARLNITNMANGDTVQNLTTTIKRMDNRSKSHYTLNREKLVDLQEEGYMVLPREEAKENETRNEKSMKDNDGHQEDLKGNRQNIPEINFINNVSINDLKDAVKKVQEIGWPPIFALVYDEFWYLLKEVHEVARGILGTDCVLEPSIFIWSLQRKNAKEAKIGQNFGLPHRDFSYTESFFASDSDSDSGSGSGSSSGFTAGNSFDSSLQPEPKILNVWIPLVDTTHNNGCLCVLPKEFDTVFDQPEHHDHMRAAIPVRKYNYENDTQSIDYYKTRIDMGGVRALQVEKGTMISWVGNLIHYGSACSSKAKEPRVSIAFTFRNKKAQKTHLCQDDVFADLFKDDQSSFILPSFEMRLRMICKSLLIYQDWYQLIDKNFPKDLLVKSN